jgi:hypothetical protein
VYSNVSESTLVSEESGAVVELLGGGWNLEETGEDVFDVFHR